MVEGWTGTHSVGVCDIEWATSGLKNVQVHAIDPSEHVVGRLFYPCDADIEAPGSAKPPRRGVPWLSRFQEATGYASFIFFSNKSFLAAVLKQLLRLALWIVGITQRLPLFREAAVHEERGPHPVVIFSHGLGGNRGTYAVLCAELASQGFVVLALEHTDGSASSYRLAGSGGWQYYGGLGQGDAKFFKVRHRQLELAAAQRLLAALNAGTTDPAQCSISGGLDASLFMRGKLDMDLLAIAGHSFGGATVGAAAAKSPGVRAAVALDPWWLGVPPEEPALKAFQTRTPLLVIGSHAWNRPYNDEGDLVCGRSQQEAILAAASAAGEGGEPGGGALLLVIANSTHDTFSDLPVLFATRFSWLLSKLGFNTELDPVAGILAVAGTTALFLHRHLPTSRPPVLPATLPGGIGTTSVAAPDVRKAAAPDQQNGGLTASDSGWSLVSADDAPLAATPGVPSEATRTDAANASRVGPGRGGSGGGSTLDAAPGAEAHADGQHHSCAPGWESRKAASGGVLLPSASELDPIGADISSGTAHGSASVGDAAGSGSRPAPRRSEAEATKLAVSKDTKESVAALLGDLVAILELHA